MKYTVLLAIVFVAAVSAQNCGPAGGGAKCSGSDCCSQWGWCGTTTDHCGTGCQGAYGVCSGSGGPGTTRTTATRTTTTTASGGGGGATLGDWSFCSTNSQCINQCCSKEYSNDGQFKCTPGGTKSKCTGSGGTPPTTTTTTRKTTTTTTTTKTTTKTTTTTQPTGTGLGDWAFCSTNSQCTNQCCSKQYSNDGMFKCTPGGDKSQCTGSGGGGTTPPSGPVKVISNCATSNTIALTFDDGPYIYNTALLDELDKAGIKATFFVNGNNYRCIYDDDIYPNVRRMVDTGHQVASHTWAHPDMATLTLSQQTSQLTQLNNALQKIIGMKPTYFRPPYGSYNSDTNTALTNQGFKISALWSDDSGDSVGASPSSSNAMYDGFQAGSTHLVLNHETYQTTVNTVIPHAISVLKSKGFRFATVGECLGDSSANWYRDRGSRASKDSSWNC